MGTTATDYYLDGGNVVGEKTGTGITNYLQGSNLISETSGSTTQYYLHNAHGDVVNLTDSTGASIKAYAYDAFGNEKNQLASDTNPFRYCGEYLDRETNEYYLKARYYDSSVGRFRQADTHWNPGNMIYGDALQQDGEYRDALCLNGYVRMPQILAICQAENLYMYCAGNPLLFIDQSGNKAIPLASYGPMPELINGQGRDPYRGIPFGTSTVGFAGCGAIAVYNAMILSGHYEVTSDSVLNYYSMKTPIRWLGTMPWEIEFYEKNVSYSRAESLDDVIDHVKNGGIAIMTFWNDTIQLPDYSAYDQALDSVILGLLSDKTAIDLFKGAHTVAIRYCNHKGKYIIFNAYNKMSIEFEKEDLNDYLSKGVFVGGICI